MPQFKKKKYHKGNKERESPVSSTENGKLYSKGKKGAGNQKFNPKRKTSQSFRPNFDSSTKTENYYLDNVEEIQGGGPSSDRNRYNLKFRRPHKEKEENLKPLKYEPVAPIAQEELEVTSETFYPHGLDYPKRPYWKRGISKEELDATENRSFRQFCEEMDKKYASMQLGLYELNLETWRQLWRVTEMSDIILIIVDARFVAAQFPPYLYKHLVEKENKGVILIMNKCDLIPSPLVQAWKKYCEENYPKLLVIPFSAFEGKSANKSKMQIAVQSSLNLIEACQRLVDNNVDLNPWRKRVKEELKEVGENFSKCEILKEETYKMEENKHAVYQRHKDNILTIGTIGYPNVGKSSLINALMGKKVVSVSRTPGHTKHFQTIFIEKNIKLCDCPGLVFPSLCPKQLQVVLGSYPIAQVTDPLSSVHYIACRIDLPKILRLKPHDFEGEPETFEWTPFHIGEAWAKRQGYFTKTKGGRLDVFRAANELLRFTLVGFKGLVVSLRPLGYSKKLSNFDFKLHEKLIQNTGTRDCQRDLKHRGGGEKYSEHSDSENYDSSNDSISECSDSEEEESGNRFALLSLQDI